MPLVQLSMYEALTEAGVQPDAARKVERQVEAAIQAGQDAVRAEMREQQLEMREQLMTKADGEVMKSELKEDISALRSELKGDIGSLRAEILRAMNEQTWKLAGFVVVANGVLLAALRLIG